MFPLTFPPPAPAWLQGHSGTCGILRRAAEQAGEDGPLLAELVPALAALVLSPTVMLAAASPATGSSKGNQQRQLQEGGFDCRSELEVLKSLLGSQRPCVQLQQRGVFFLETNQLCWLVPLSPWHQKPQDFPRLSHAVNAVTTSFLLTQKPRVVIFCLPGSSGKVQQSPTRVPGPACPSQRHFLPGSALGIPLMRLLPAAITFYGSQPEAN